MQQTLNLFLVIYDIRICGIAVGCNVQDYDYLSVFALLTSQTLPIFHEVSMKPCLEESKQATLPYYYFYLNS